MMNMSRLLVAVCLAAWIEPVKAITIDWTGGAGTENFGDVLNWSQDPEFTGSDPLVSTNTHRIAEAAQVTTGGTNFSYASTILTHPEAVFTVTSDSVVTNFGGQWLAGEVHIYGTLDAGGGVIGSTPTQQDILVNVYSGGFFRAVGNNSFSGNGNDNRDVEINVAGDMLLKLNMPTAWIFSGTNNNFLVRVQTGGVYRVNQGGAGNINMRCDSDSTARIELWGGFMNLGTTNQYNVANITNAGNGIIFMAEGSSISIFGSNVVAVQEWIDAGVLSSEVPSSTIEMTYMASSNVTIVSLSGDGGADPELGVSPVSLDFGGVLTGGTPGSLLMTVTNSGESMLEGTAALSGGAPFSIASGSSYTIEPAGFTNVVITFDPHEAGYFADSILFESNGGASTSTVSGYGLILAGSTGKAISVVSGELAVSFGLSSGAIYRVEATTNLLDTLAWQPLTGLLTNWAGDEVLYTDTNAATPPVRHFRLNSTP